MWQRGSKTEMGVKCDLCGIACGHTVKKHGDWSEECSLCIMYYSFYYYYYYYFHCQYCHDFYCCCYYCYAVIYVS